MTALLSIRSNTARAIARTLQIPIYRKQPPIDMFCIRWGSTYPYHYTLNSREAIIRSSNKPLCRQILREVGVPTPEPTETDFPVVGRPRHHRGGKQFYLCNSYPDVKRAKEKGAVYFSKFYPKKHEFRVHVGSGKTLLFSQKFGDVYKPNWNTSQGFRFKHLRRSEWIDNNLLLKIQRTAKKAIETLGLDFGCVDIMASAGENYPDHVVSEINVAPGGSPLTISKYVDYFQTHLSHLTSQPYSSILPSYLGTLNGYF